MKRYRIEVNKKGVAIFDKKNKLYVLDASIIEQDNSFSICKRLVKQKKVRSRELSYEYEVLKKDKPIKY